MWKSVKPAELLAHLRWVCSALCCSRSRLLDCDNDKSKTGQQNPPEAQSPLCLAAGAVKHSGPTWNRTIRKLQSVHWSASAHTSPGCKGSKWEQVQLCSPHIPHTAALIKLITSEFNNTTLCHWSGADREGRWSTGGRKTALLEQQKFRWADKNTLSSHAYSSPVTGRLTGLHQLFHRGAPGRWKVWIKTEFGTSSIQGGFIAGQSRRRSSVHSYESCSVGRYLSEDKQTTI